MEWGPYGGFNVPHNELNILSNEWEFVPDDQYDPTCFGDMPDCPTAERPAMFYSGDNLYVVVNDGKCASYFWLRKDLSDTPQSQAQT